MSGKELKAIRNKLKITQAELADLIGLHWNTVARWERDEVSISEPMARLIVRIEQENSSGKKRSKSY